MVTIASTGTTGTAGGPSLYVSPTARRFLLVLALVCIVPSASGLQAREDWLPAANARWTRYDFLKGTAYETAYYVSSPPNARSAQSPEELEADAQKRSSRSTEPVAVLVAPHADERSAGLFLKRLVRSGNVERGKLLVIPAPIGPAWRDRRRYVIEDLNRQFGPFSESHSPVDMVASLIRRKILQLQPVILLNIHEGWGHVRQNWDYYGQGFIIDDPALFPLCRKVADTVNSTLPEDEHFLPAYKPMPRTLTFWATQEKIPAIGIEVAKEISARRKLHLQSLIISRFLAEMGIIISFPD